MSKKGIYKNCKRCGDKFYEFPYQKREFCSRSCANKANAKKLSEARIGKGNPMYGKKPWNKDLKYKNKKISIKIKAFYKKGGKKGFQKGNKTKSQYKKGHEGMNGKDNPSWQGGKSFEPYNVEWTTRKKNFIKKRDNFTCQKCNKRITKKINPKEKKGKDWLTVHHIDYDKMNCKNNNLITLCHKCNCSVNANRKYWTKYFNNLICIIYGK